MIYTIRDIELLRLLRWLRCISPNDLKRLFGEGTVSNLKNTDLIRSYRANRSISLTAKGNRMLNELFADMPDSIKLAHTAADTLRRVRVSRIAMTAYQAGLSVFTTKLAALEQERTFFLPSLMRGRGANLWSNSRIAALLRLGDALYAAHYVCKDVGEMLLLDELNAFNNNTAQIRNVRRGFFFAGASYQEILAELDAAPTEKLGRYVSYADAFRHLSLPVHLLSCDAVGAMQLRLMALPDYRQTLTRAALQAKFAPAPRDALPWDAMFDGKPFVMAADMDLRRIDAALGAARERGIGQIVMAALKQQVEAVLRERYRDTGLARVYSIKEDTLRELGINALYTPPLEGYRTEKGDVIDAPLIQAARKTGRPSGKQARTLV